MTPKRKFEEVFVIRRNMMMPPDLTVEALHRASVDMAENTFASTGALPTLLVGRHRRMRCAVVVDDLAALAGEYIAAL